MDRPKPISSGDVMRWNADVERRRREYHERRCAEDPIYKRAYERQTEMIRRMQKMQSGAMTLLQNAMNEAENTKCQQATDQMNMCNEHQKVKSHEEIMLERMALLERVGHSLTPCDFTFNECALAAGVMAMIFDPEASQRLKDFQEEIPYVEEIRKADKEFDSEMICMSGFEW